MAIVPRALPAEHQSTSQASIRKKFKWAVNEVVTSVLSLSNTSSRDGDTILLFFTGSVFGGIILLGLNSFACSFVDYMTDWDVPKYFYPYTTLGVPIEALAILAFGSVIQNILSYKKSYTYDEAEKSLAYIFSDFKKIPSAYWQAPRALIDYPQTLLGKTLWGTFTGVAAGYLPSVILGGMALGLDLIRCELSGYKMKDYSVPEIPTLIFLATALLATAAATITGFNLGLVQGVDAAKENREDEKPTAIQSATRFLQKFSFYRATPGENHHNSENEYRNMTRKKR